MVCCDHEYSPRKICNNVPLTVPESSATPYCNARCNIIYASTRQTRANRPSEVNWNHRPYDSGTISLVRDASSHWPTYKCKTSFSIRFIYLPKSSSSVSLDVTRTFDGLINFDQLQSCKGPAQPTRQSHYRDGWKVSKLTRTTALWNVDCEMRVALG